MTAPEKPASAVSTAGQTRRRELQAMLRDRERDLQDAFQRRIRGVPAQGRHEGLDSTAHAEADRQDIEVLLLQWKEDTLRQIRDAMVRLDAGEYGQCTGCGGEIPAQQVHARPFAVRCTACEASLEQRAGGEPRSDANSNGRATTSFTDMGGTRASVTTAEAAVPGRNQP